MTIVFDFTNPVPDVDDVVGWEIYQDEINREIWDEIALEESNINWDTD